METKNLTIMFTDMEGFTERSSQATREELSELIQEHTKTLVPIFEKRRGKVIKTIGDAFLVSFETATEAVLAAKEIQETLRQQNELLDEKKRFRIKIGINTGDVNLIENDVFGDAVNIASRVQNICPAGETYLTSAAYLAMNKREVEVESIGEESFKGVSERIALYRVKTSWNQDKNPKRASVQDKGWNKTPAPSVMRLGAFLVDSVVVVLAFILVMIFATDFSAKLDREKVLKAEKERLTEVFKRENLQLKLLEPGSIIPPAYPHFWEISRFRNENDPMVASIEGDRDMHRFLLFLFALTYFSLCTFLFSRTLGKALFKLRVEDLSGMRLGFFKSLYRSLLYLISILPFGLGLLAGVFSKEGLTWHDKLAGSRVRLCQKTWPN